MPEAKGVEEWRGVLNKVIKGTEERIVLKSWGRIDLRVKCVFLGHKWTRINLVEDVLTSCLWPVQKPTINKIIFIGKIR